MKLRIIGTAALVALSTMACAEASAAPENAPLTVRVNTGLIQGNANASTRHFLGVPYAKPPIGALRWTPPQPASPWRGVRKATRPGSSCPQKATPGQSASTNEDCLFVNVTTPRKQTPGVKLPVMVWWHGGGYDSGNGSTYGADRLAAQGNVIVVTLNYRLGAFGYFGLPGLPGSGDFGLEDQIAGLRWAKSNAAAFGGDPNNTTVFGESAGGMSTCAMLTSPQAWCLVNKAIMSSGSCRLDWAAGALYPGEPESTPYTSLREDTADGLAAAHQSGCLHNELSCMRAKPAADLVPLNQSFSDHLSYDTPLLPQNPATALRAGRFLRVPVISGGNRDEERAFVGGAATADPKLITAQTYPTLLRAAFGADADRVAARYPLARYGSAPLAWATITTDASWACPTATADRELAAHTTVYPYEFADPNTPNVNGFNVPGLPQGAAHATELPSLFDLGGINWLAKKGTKAQQDMAATMVGYWTAFAHTGDPNHAGAPNWAAGTVRGTGQLQLIPGRIRQVDVAAQHQCGFWATIR